MGNDPAEEERVKPEAPDRLPADAVAVGVHQPFDAPGVFGFLATRAVDGIESLEPDSAGDGGCSGDPGSAPPRLRYARTLRFPGGPGAFEVTATLTPGEGWRLAAAFETPTASDRVAARALVGRLFDVGADPLTIDAALAADPSLAPLVARTPGIRAPGAVEPHELVIRALIGQQISVAAARTHLGRLAAHAGVPYASRFAGLSHVFPTAAQIAAGVPEPPEAGPLDPDRPLRLPRAAIRAIRRIAEALAGGQLEVHQGADPDAMRAALLSFPRVGPWTASYIAMRVLGDADAWLEGDVALLAGARRVGLLDPAASNARGHRLMAERARAWAPWRSYAAMHIWRAASGNSTR